ncbi:MAG: hypothetical protein ACOZQL_35475 [Myxococcota bacterium]
MKKWMLAAALAASGCVTAEATEKRSDPVEATRDGRDAAAAMQLKAVLESLPRCEPGAPVGLVTVTPTTCTKMYCGKACCNTCGWRATHEQKNGEKVAVEPARLRDVLELSESALECEVAAWSQVLSTQSLALDGAACVVR